MLSEQLDAMPQNWTPIQALADSNIIGIIFTRKDGSIIRANDEFLRIVGYSRSDLDEGKLNWNSLTPPEWREAASLAASSIAATGTAPPFEKEYLRKDGHRAAVLIGVVELAGPDLHTVCFVLDISEQKRAENQRDRLMLERAAMLDSIGDGIYVMRTDGSCSFINQAGARILGYQPEECTGKSLHELVHYKRPDGSPYPKEECPFYIAHRAGLESRSDDETVWAKDGSPISVEYSCSPIIENQRHEGSVVCFKETTERKKAEAAIRASEERFRGAFNNAAAGLFITDLQGVILEVNHAFCEMTGYSETELVGTPYQSVAHPSDLSRDAVVLGQLLRQEIPGFVGVERFVKKDGSLLWSRLSVSTARDGSGRMSNIICLIEDITERLRAETELHRSEERYRGIVENTHEGICMCNADRKITFCNQRLTNMLDYSEGALIRCSQLHFEEDEPESQRGFERRKQGQSESYEMRLRRKDGKPVWTNTSASPLKDEAGHFAGALCMFTDINERKRLEEQLRQSQKMEALGRLAGGIAHDFNNLLTVILGYAGVIENKLGPGDRLGKNVVEIRKAGERAAELTQKLLAFTRKQVQSSRILSLNHLIRDAEPMLRRLIGEDIQLSVTLDPAVGNIKADPVQIEQVLMNLSINARDAMPKGGRLTIVTETHNLDSGAAGLCSLPPGAYVLLEVTDTGCGMDEATQARIFEPFFTTKDPGIGTGLGLATVLGIVNQSGGAISVYSELEAGSVFKIYLPLVEDAATSVNRPKHPVASANGETILVVEDDSGIRILAGELLREKGYKVLEAASGEEALVLGDALATVDLLLTDVIMTGMNGQELATRLAAEHPGIGILYMSGYTDCAIAQQTLLDPGLSFLPKPFQPEELLRKVALVLSKDKDQATVLVVDDEAQVRSFLVSVLEADGYTVLEAADGREAQARCQEYAVDLVITDLVMPDQEGLETIHTLGRQSPDIPVIAISGAFGGAYLQLAKKLGAQAVFRKPFQAEAILSEVHRLTKR